METTNLPPHNKTNQREDDDNDGGNGSAHCHRQNFPIDLARRSIISSNAGASLIPRRVVAA